jgi:hypothetical protein
VWNSKPSQHWIGLATSDFPVEDIPCDKAIRGERIKQMKDEHPKRLIG